MIVFKTFLKVLNANKIPILLYTIILVSFCGFNMKTNEEVGFTVSRPDIFIVNEAQEEGITKHFIEYLKENTNVVDLEKDKIEDALFYRDISLILYIPKNFKEDFLNGKDPEIQIKSTQDYKASLAENILKKYLKVAKIYQKSFETEEEMLKKITETLSENVEIEMTSKIDTDNLSKLSSYYNFASYSILAGSVYVICLILSSFKEKNIKKRTMISSMDNKKYNHSLLLSNSLFAILLWLVYVLLSIVLVGKIVFSAYGGFLILNSFLFTICALTLSFFIGNIVSDKNAINGIVNVIALGSSFLCGVFVPIEWLPESVLKIAHFLPSYYYVISNENIVKLEMFTLDAMKPILNNMFILICFSLIFVISTNIISGKKRKIS